MMFSLSNSYIPNGRRESMMRHLPETLVKEKSGALCGKTGTISEEVGHVGVRGVPRDS